MNMSPPNYRSFAAIATIIAYVIMIVTLTATKMGNFSTLLGKLQAQSSKPFLLHQSNYF
jgi:hypothetical protein